MSVASVEPTQSYAVTSSRLTPVAAPQPEPRTVQPEAVAPRSDELTRIAEAGTKRQEERRNAAPADATGGGLAIEKKVDISLGLVYGTTTSFVKIEKPDDGAVLYTIPQGYEDYAKDNPAEDQSPRVRYSI